MASSNECMNDLLRPGHVLFGVNSSGRILRLDAETKPTSSSRGVHSNPSEQGWKVSKTTSVLIRESFESYIYIHTDYLF